jgi:hypothetical protein
VRIYVSFERSYGSITDTEYSVEHHAWADTEAVSVAVWDAA